MALDEANHRLIVFERLTWLSRIAIKHAFHPKASDRSILAGIGPSRDPEFPFGKA
jgi:hypothetical protein